MGRLVRLVGSGIGLASEAIQNRRSSPSRSPSSSSTPSRGESSRSVPQQNFNEPPPRYVEVPEERAQELFATGQAVPAALDEKKRSPDAEDDDDLSVEDDEEQWDLDEALESPQGEEPPEATGTEQTPDQIADEFMRSHPPPPYTPGKVVRGNLPCPVIIPQRRPRSKGRGFIRAYAPVLADCGIDQATFLDFLKTFHKSSQASPWLHVINIAAMAAGFAPSVIAMAVSTAVNVAVGVTMEVQRRSR